MHLFLSSPGSGQPGPEIETLNGLRRSELGALKIYQRAINAFEAHPAHPHLCRIRQRHEAAAGLLRELVFNLDGEPDDAAGDWGVSDRLISDPPSLNETLAVLRQAEERGLAEYEAFLQADEMPEEARYAVRTQLLPLCHLHIDELLGMTGGPRPKG